MCKCLIHQSRVFFCFFNAALSGKIQVPARLIQMETSKGCHARIPPPCGCFYPSRSPNVPIYRYTDVAGWEELCALSSDLHFLPVTSGVSAEHQNTKEWFGGGGVSSAPVRRSSVHYIFSSHDIHMLHKPTTPKINESVIQRTSRDRIEAS